MAVVKNIDVALRANISKFEAGLRQGAGLVKNFVSSSLQSLTAMFGGVGGAASVAGAAIASFGAAIKHAMAETDRVGDISAELGIDPNRLLELENAAMSVGVSASTLQGGLQKLTIASAKAAEGNKQLQKTFSRLSIDFNEIAAASPDEKLAMLSEGMSKLDSASQRARLAVQLFGKEGISLVQVLELGRKGLDEAAERTRFFGNVVSERGTKAVTAWEKAWADIKLTVDGFSQQLLRLFGPALENSAKLISGVSSGFAELREIVFGIGRATPAVEGLAKATDKVVRKLAVLDPEVARGLKLTEEADVAREKKFMDGFLGFMKTARDDAKAMIDSLAPIKTPLDIFLEKSRRIHELHAMDLVTLEQRNELLRKANDEFAAPGMKRLAAFRDGLMKAASGFRNDFDKVLREPVSGPAAVERGTQDAFRAFQEAKAGQEIAKDQLAVQKKMAADLAAMRRNGVLFLRAPLGTVGVG